MDSNNNIVYINIYDIIKELLLNYFITLKYQTLLISQVIRDKIRGKNTKAIFLPNQA